MAVVQNVHAPNIYSAIKFYTHTLGLPCLPAHPANQFFSKSLECALKLYTTFHPLQAALPSGNSLKIQMELYKGKQLLKTFREREIWLKKNWKRIGISGNPSLVLCQAMLHMFVVHFRRNQGPFLVDPWSEACLGSFINQGTHWNVLETVRF